VSTSIPYVESPEQDDTTSSAEYESGFADGRASRDAEVEALNRIADYWYFRANNPGAKTPGEKVVDDIIAGMEVNEERRRTREALDAAEKELFQKARDLIAEGMEDLDVAATVGLFLPIVQNLRAGVL
jgi:hypothetical protein